MNKNKPVVQIENLCKEIGNKRIVNDISLDIYPGEIFGFLGPNGAGKTTTIRMLVGLVSMTEGCVLIKGRDVSSHFEQAISQVGAIVENPEFYDYLTGYQNLIHFARMSGNITEERIMDMIELVGLENAIYDKVKIYSLGMRQRLGLAQALMHAPSVLILDEPTNGLDPAGIREFRHYLKKLTKEEGLAILVSSHLLAEMELMCDRIGIIQHGKLIKIQDVHELVEATGDTQVTFTVNPISKAIKMLKELFAGKVQNIGDHTIEMNVDHQQIPQVVKSFVESGISIYGVDVKSKTLEDKFIEVTGGPQID
ncbi:ABC transporter ATP-binding protein [Halalkalibacter hemicellulosilyticus]|uniref:ABC transporter n=1 Tax=Halalkalibacter hemicellulosilyticusJCM 9152 TaxID=1236971 RepID=W4QAK9_9BACI|nr:ABC transporter ATP-binding protein [Halalkalibacter hemicellulosilyticus]GAE28723.1 ABC transporter [Halalkalibacter hemicellulosilyticusJCM 9152]